MSTRQMDEDENTFDQLVSGLYICLFFWVLSGEPEVLNEE